MKIEKTGSEILSIRKTVSNDFTITNSKGEEMEINIETYYQDDELMGYDNDENISIKDEKGNWKTINWSDIEDFIGEDEDIDDLQYEINELMDK